MVWFSGVRGRTIVAVKTLKKNAGEKERADLLQELAVMKTLEPHENVVRLLGCCTISGKRIIISSMLTSGMGNQEMGNTPYNHTCVVAYPLPFQA